MHPFIPARRLNGYNQPKRPQSLLVHPRGIYEIDSIWQCETIASLLELGDDVTGGAQRPLLAIQLLDPLRCISIVEGVDGRSAAESAGPVA